MHFMHISANLKHDHITTRQVKEEKRYLATSMNIGIDGERRRMTGFGHRLSGRLSNAFARLAEESSTVDNERVRWTSSLPALPEDDFNDPFVRPNATMVVDGQRRVLSRDDSFIRRRPSTMTTASSESDDTCGRAIDPFCPARSTEEKSGESVSLDVRFNSSFCNASTTIKDAFNELASETKREAACSTQKSGKIDISDVSDAVLKARTVERVRRRMMLSKDDSFINRTDASKLEPFHFSFTEGAFRRVRNKDNSKQSQASGPITTWKRPTLAESWDIANTLNIQSAESTRHVGSGINRNTAA